MTAKQARRPTSASVSCSAETMSIRIARQHELRAEGIRADRARPYRRVSRGLYATGAPDGPDDEWRADLSARLKQSGPQAVVGLRSAARLHRLDGFRDATEVDTLTSKPHHARTSKVHRTGTLHDDDIVVVDGFSTTSVARTLVDLGRVVHDEAVELAVESALRGDNPGTPFVWNTTLLDDLHARVVMVRARTGGATLRRVLQRRPPGSRPTGSFAETSLLQGLREVGLGAVRRQVDVRFVSSTGEIVRCLCPDFCFDDRLLLIEVNGAAPRGGATMTADDVERQNLLAKVFRMHVVAGVTAVDPRKRRGAAAEIRALVCHTPTVAFPTTVGSIGVLRTPTGFDLYTGNP